jgi:hypothetical protein
MYDVINLQTCCQLMDMQRQTRSNGHRHQFLEQQLARIRHRHLRNLLATTSSALENVLDQICDREQTTLVANVDSAGIGNVEEAPLQKLGSSVGNHTYFVFSRYKFENYELTEFKKLFLQLGCVNLLFEI